MKSSTPSTVNASAHREPISPPGHNSTTPQRYKMTPVRTKPDLDAIKILFASYAASLNLDLSFQDFANEMANLPGKYAPEVGGELLLARRIDAANGDRGEAIGCVALRGLDGGICEMKRLYTAPQARGMGLGRALAREVVDVAKRYGYEQMRLDTLPSMEAAQGLYRELGFVDVEPYCENPVEGVRWLGLDLREGKHR